jgi:1-acyl-sn-glycerol-3-phosphate acyltransferase
VSAGTSSARSGRGTEVPFVLDTRWTPLYRVARQAVRIFLRVWFRPVVEGRAEIPDTGPVILAPVHRSFADFVFAAAVTERKLFYMAKASLWRSRVLGRVLVTVGAFPVHRGSADREALHRAEQVLEQGQVLVMFPEGTRQAGSEVQPLLDGVAFLASRHRAPMVPIGIGGSDRSMPVGSKVPRPMRISVVAGPPVAPPTRPGTGRVARSALNASSAALRAAIQDAYDRARALVD